MVFTLFVIHMLIVLERFLNEKKLTVLKNVIFFILTASKNVKIQKVKFEVGFSYKDCI